MWYSERTEGQVGFEFWQDTVWHDVEYISTANTTEEVKSDPHEFFCPLKVQQEIRKQSEAKVINHFRLNSITERPCQFPPLQESREPSIPWPSIEIITVMVFQIFRYWEARFFMRPWCKFCRHLWWLQFPWNKKLWTIYEMFWRIKNIYEYYGWGKSEGDIDKFYDSQGK